MSPPDDSDTAEIYVEVRIVGYSSVLNCVFGCHLLKHASTKLLLIKGKRKMVDGFIRWCKRGNVGLNQMTTVKEVLDESPTGLYDGFYVKTH